MQLVRVADTVHDRLDSSTNGQKGKMYLISLHSTCIILKISWYQNSPSCQLFVSRFSFGQYNEGGVGLRFVDELSSHSITKKL